MDKSSQSKSKVYLVEDHQLFREGLTQLINREPDMVVCGEAENVAEAERGLEKSKPDMVIVDISLNEGNGIDLVKSIRERDEELPILVLSMHDESLYAERALRAGSNGYIMKQEANKTIRDAIRRVLNGEIYLSEKMSSKMVSKIVGGRPQAAPSPLETLSQRELEVFQKIGQGYSTRQIAEDMKLTVPTINSFRARIKEKLQLGNANELVLAAIQWVQHKKLELGS